MVLEKINLILYFQPHNICLRCLYCQASVLETDLESHIRVEHRIGHDRAVEMLIGLQYSEVASIHQPEVEAVSGESLIHPIQEQVPVNEQPAVR